ncbi:MAG: hypothetical protein QF662_06365, partial [Phycisphaerae bacterium]|nr:hypothetical protein [Phycisphaerae bacterium]
DNHALSGMVDGVVLILHASASKKGVAQRAHGQLALLKARVLGAVLNAVRATRGGYFRESYRAYYDYLRPDMPPEGAAGESDNGTTDAEDALDDLSKPENG